MSKYNYNTPIRYIRGLGPKRAKTLNKMGLETVLDLLDRHPLSYIYPGLTSIADAKEGETVVIKAKVKKISRGWGSIVQATLIDDTGRIDAVWYNSPWLLDRLRPGVVATFYSKYKGGTLQQPKWTLVEGGMKDVYGGQYGSKHHATIKAALKEVLGGKSCAEPNTYLPAMYDGASRTEVYNTFHFPFKAEHQQSALRELKLDELCVQQLALADRRERREQVEGTVIYLLDVSDQFPYQLTDDQLQAIGDIRKDLSSGRVMQRLLHADVGAGKSAVAFAACIGCALQGHRSIILAPTTILAQQHYDNLKKMGVPNVTLYGVDSHMESIIVGTHAILNQQRILESASLVIIDEFSKFGVEQRAKATKHNPHLLLMSATPQPRSLMAAVYGDLDVSVIRQQPIKRGSVVTKWVLPEKREAVYEVIDRELAVGHQAYVVYPRIGGDEDVVSAERGFKEISARYPEYVVKLLTGKTKNKTGVMQGFKTGCTQILVSTVIAEVGLDNPNATVMAIEGADRFGLSQLHQLRGRVCRSTDIAYCFLVAETANQTSIDRLTVIEQTNDGFALAEEDLRLRGPGDLFSPRQHGLPDLKHADLCDDFDLIQEARDLVAANEVGEGSREMMELRYTNLSLGDTV